MRLTLHTTKQFAKFGIVGVVNTTITLGTIFILANMLHLSYILANSIGYLLGFANSFYMNKTWTFKSEKPFVKEGLLFVLLFGFCYILQLTILILLKEKFNLNANLSQLIAMFFYSILNFSGNKYITFKN